jgi:hypothetical protein
MTRVGITGHRDLPEPTCKLVSAAIATHLGRFDSIDGISSLAEGADQIFDGTPSQGVGGTADVVAFAGERGVPTTVVWPPSARRG